MTTLFRPLILLLRYSLIFINFCSSHANSSTFHIQIFYLIQKKEEKSFHENSLEKKRTKDIKIINE